MRQYFTRIQWRTQEFCWGGGSTNSVKDRQECGPGGSVGIATELNGLDGPASNPGGDEIFRPSRPALGPTQSPVQWVPGLSRG
jgi:hypothetical protein